ncbi:hypothetical protein BaRGS_00035665 [Batillaria attramentaria]|uniref:Uncharacterized protein n=1 Tax=Batillaria attramentaria TaxID=370345 RepID=A0ABD0JE18_9CAEN
MSPTTRSVSAKYNIEVEKIKRTKDSKQVTFETNATNLPLWRHALRARYVIDPKPEEVTSVWTDHEKDHDKTLSLPHPLHPPLPPELFKTFLQLYLNRATLLTITVYYSTAKILVQGNVCVEWVNEEFRKLRSFVNTASSQTGMPTMPSVLPPLPLAGDENLSARLAIQGLSDTEGCQTHEAEIASEVTGDMDQAPDTNSNPDTDGRAT